MKRGLLGVTCAGISHGVYHYSHGSSCDTKKRLSVEDPMVWSVRLFMPRLKLMGVNEPRARVFLYKICATCPDIRSVF